MRLSTILMLTPAHPLRLGHVVVPEEPPPPVASDTARSMLMFVWSDFWGATSPAGVRPMALT